jgi:hypothetical protein
MNDELLPEGGGGRTGGGGVTTVVWPAIKKYFIFNKI